MRKWYLEFRPLVDIISESLFQVLDTKLFTLIGKTTWCLGWNQYTANDMDNTIFRNAILDGYAAKPINLHSDQPGESANINTQTLVLKQSWQINMEVSLRKVFLVDLAHDVGFSALGFIKGIGVEGLVSNYMVLEKSFEVFLAVRAEEESVDFGAEALEGGIGGSEEGAAFVGRRFYGCGETGFKKGKLQSTEFAREKLNNLEGRGWW